MLSVLPVVIGLIIALVAGGVVGFFVGAAYRKKTAEAKIGSAEE